MRTIECIEAIICECEGIAPEKLKSICRKRELNDVRQVVMYFAVLSGKTLNYTGAYYGRNYATVIHARKAVQNRYDTEPEFKNKIDLYNLMLKESDKYDMEDYCKSKLIRLKIEVSELANELNKIAI